MITKALEVEAKKRFFTKYIDYNYRKYNKNYSKYPTTLLYKGKLMESEKFTMGSIAFVMGYKENYYDLMNKKKTIKKD